MTTGSTFNKGLTFPSRSEKSCVSSVSPRIRSAYKRDTKECASQFQLNNAISVKLNVFSDGFLLRDGNKIVIVSCGFKIISNTRYLLKQMSFSTRTRCWRNTPVYFSTVHAKTTRAVLVKNLSGERCKIPEEKYVSPLSFLPSLLGNLSNILNIKVSQIINRMNVLDGNYVRAAAQRNDTIRHDEHDVCFVSSSAVTSLVRMGNEIASGLRAGKRDSRGFARDSEY